MDHMYQFFQAGSRKQLGHLLLIPRCTFFGSLISRLFFQSMASYYHYRLEAKVDVLRDDHAASASHQGPPSLRLCDIRFSA